MLTQKNPDLSTDISVFTNNSKPPLENIDPIVEKLWGHLLPFPEYSINNLRTWSREDLNQRLTQDVLLDNLKLNKWEFANGVARMESFPWKISVPFDYCNARCSFCLGWLCEKKDDVLNGMLPLADLMRRMVQINLVGTGEPLIYQKLDELLFYFRDTIDPRSRIGLTTNGSHLLNWVEKLLAAHVKAYTVSLHAASPYTHNMLMGLGTKTFDRAVDGIQELIRQSKASGIKIDVGLAYIVTQHNIAEIPQFIELAQRLSVNSIHFRALVPCKSAKKAVMYRHLPPYLHPDFEKHRQNALAAITESSIKVIASPDTWNTPVFDQDMLKTIQGLEFMDVDQIRAMGRSETNKYLDSQAKIISKGISADSSQQQAEDQYSSSATTCYKRSHPYLCPSPYTTFYYRLVNSSFSPCCYIEPDSPAYARPIFRADEPFHNIWNCKQNIDLRHSLHFGPLKKPCLKCPFYW